MDPFQIPDHTFSGKQHSLYRTRYNLGRFEISIVFYLINRQHLFYSLPSPRVTTQLNLNIQGTSKCPIINIKRLHLSYIMSIFISLVNSIHLFELCTSDMSNGCLPSFLVLWVKNITQAWSCEMNLLIWAVLIKSLFAIWIWSRLSRCTFVNWHGLMHFD